MAKSGRPLKVHEDLNRLRHLVEVGKKLQLRRLLRKHGINAYDGDKRNALIWASFFDKQDLVKWLIKKGADINFQDRSGYCCLHYCSLERNIETAKILLENKADINTKDEHGNPPIWTAIFNAKGNFNMVKLLMDFGAVTNEKNIHGKSPDDFAMTVYKKTIADLLI